MANTKVPAELSSTPGIVDNSNATAITIDSNEHVAIGDRGVNPMGLTITGTVLAVSDSSDVASFQLDGVTGTRIDMGTNSSRNAVFYTDATQLEISRTTDHPIKFKTNSSERMRITGAGAVGIGVSNPSGKFEVGGGTSSSGVASHFSSSAGYTDPVAANASHPGGAKIVLWNDSSTPQKSSIGMDGNADIWFNNSGAQTGGFTFYTGNGASATPEARLTIKKAGNIGIGTTNPGETLEVKGDASFIEINHPTASSFSGMKWSEGGVPQGSIQNMGSTFSTVARRGNLEIFHNTGGNVTLQHPGGNVGIGTSSPGYTLDVSGGSGTMARITSGGSSTYLAIANTSNTGYIGIDGTNMAFYPTGTKRGNLDSSGNFVVSGNVTAYGSPSDIKLKENIEVIDNALDKVKQLKGITYDLKSDGNRLTGLIAQDLEKVLPEAVYTAKDLEDEEHLAIRYGNTVGLLVEAIKELEARVKELEAK